MTLPPVEPPRSNTRNITFLVAGTAGGVGTTTIAALLGAALRARTGYPPRIVDHTGGTLSRRIANISPNASYAVYDLGTNMETIGKLARPGCYPIIVAGSNPNDTAAARFALHQPGDVPVAGRGSRFAERVVVINSTSRRRKPLDAAARLYQATPGTAFLLMPWDPTLTVPGPVDQIRSGRATASIIAQIFEAFGAF